MPEPTQPAAAADATNALTEYMPQLIEYGTGIVKFIVIIVIGWMVAKSARRFALNLMTKRNVDAALRRFLSEGFGNVVLAMTFIAALGAVGIETTSLVAVLGPAGLAVGLALQGNMSHFASGVMILFFRPFTIDDVITAAGHTGLVHEIGLSATTLHTPDGQKILIPNGAITGGSIVNITTRGTRRMAVDVGVAYGADIDKVMSVLTKAASKPSTALSDPGPAVAFVGLGASSLDFTVMAWCKSGDFLTLLHDMRVAVYDELNAAGIDIPYNQIVVHQAPAE